MKRTPRTPKVAAEKRCAGKKLRIGGSRKNEKKAILCVLLTLAMSVNAFCFLEVPTDTVVQNLNGSQQAIKTYTIPPTRTRQQTLIEEPFELKGFLYTFETL